MERVFQKFLYAKTITKLILANVVAIVLVPIQGTFTSMTTGVRGALGGVPLIGGALGSVLVAPFALLGTVAKVFISLVFFVDSICIVVFVFKFCRKHKLLSRAFGALRKVRLPRQLRGFHEKLRLPQSKALAGVARLVVTNVVAFCASYLAGALTALLSVVSQPFSSIPVVGTVLQGAIVTVPLIVIYAGKALSWVVLAFDIFVLVCLLKKILFRRLCRNRKQGTPVAELEGEVLKHVDGEVVEDEAEEVVERVGGEVVDAEEINTPAESDVDDTRVRTRARRATTFDIDSVDFETERTPEVPDITESNIFGG